MAPGWHLTTRPGAIVFLPDYTNRGRFVLESESFRFPGTSPAGFGVRRRRWSGREGPVCGVPDPPRRQRRGRIRRWRTRDRAPSLDESRRGHRRGCPGDVWVVADAGAPAKSYLDVMPTKHYPNPASAENKEAIALRKSKPLHSAGRRQTSPRSSQPSTERWLRLRSSVNRVRST